MISSEVVGQPNLRDTSIATTNPALWPLLAYLGVWYINDIFTLPIGGITITLNQIVIVLGIFYVLSAPRRLNGTSEYRRIAIWLIVYLLVTTLSVLHAFFVYNSFNANYISVMAN